MIEVRGIHHGFPREGKAGDIFPVLDDVSFAIKDGRIASLLGPSGCGKTTLLRIIDGLIRPLAGEIRIDGTLVRKPGTDRTMVFQEFNLLPWRTARKNIEFAAELHGVSRNERRERADDALRRVGLDRFADYYPHQLSGGMKQRVGLARALSTNPKFLLMDEPFGALDPQIREIMQIELLKLLEAEGKTIVLVTHSIDEAIFLSDTVVIFSANPGRVISTLDIDLPRPRWSKDEEIKASKDFVA
jgi:NitT/TauT family transport system ATP-binding protein